MKNKAIDIRRFTFALLMIVLVIVLAACGGRNKKQQTQGEPTAAPTEDRTENNSENTTEAPTDNTQHTHSYDNDCDEICNDCSDVRVPLIEHAYVENSRAAATCTSEGYIIYVCPDCGATKREGITVLGHTESSWLEQTEMTCLSDGAQYKVCVVCDERLADKTVPASGHVWQEATIFPTCTLNGYVVRSCTKCGMTEKCYEVAALGHDADEWQIDREATCELEGFYHVTCNRCDALITSRELEANGHEWTQALLYSDTEHWQMCLICGSESDHKEHSISNEDKCECGYGSPCVHSGGVATCSQRAECDKCGEEYGVYVPHTPDSYATCTTAQTCNVCDRVIIPARGHARVEDASVSPTCNRDGLTAGEHCIICGYVSVPQRIVPMLGHTVIADNAVAPSCTATGLSAGEHCGTCGEIIKAQEIVPAIGHTEAVILGVDPTCTTAGRTDGRVCTVCAKFTVEQAEIPMLGHRYDDADDMECNICHAKKDLDE